MNLNYEIAWIDDQPDNVLNIAREISDGIVEIGFRPTIKYFRTPTEIDSLLRDHQTASRFDLFLVDWHLMDSQQGDDIIDAIRNDGLFTDVVFYSSSGIDALRTVVHEKKLEGVFLADRRIKFAQRSLGVIKSTVKKVVDTENMRGIAASCIADIDHKIGATILALHDSLEEVNRIKLTKILNDDLNKQKGHQIASLSGKLSKLSLQEIVIDTRYCASADLVRNFDTLHQAFSTRQAINEKVSQLVPELEHLLQIRNQLAHKKLDTADGIVVRHNNKETRYTLDDEGFRNVRVRFVSTIEKLEKIFS